MTLQCILCGKIIVLNDNPLHYAVCSSCNCHDLTESQIAIIENQTKSGINHKRTKSL